MSSLLLCLLLTACAQAPYWQKTTDAIDPATVTIIYKDVVPCWPWEAVTACFDWNALTLTVQAGLSDEMTRCVLSHELYGKHSHAAGYTHVEALNSGRMDCGDGTSLDLKSTANF